MATDKFPWYVKAPPGSPDTYTNPSKVTFAWANPPKWIYDIISKADYSDEFGSIYAAQHAAVPTLICCISPGYFFSVSVIGSNSKTLPGALPHDRIYDASEKIAAFYGISVRTVLHIADHWFLATLRMSKWLFPRSYFIAVRSFGYAFHQLMRSNKAITQ